MYAVNGTAAAGFWSRIEQITAAGDRLDEAMVLGAEDLAQLPDTLHERTVGDSDIRPNGLVKVLLEHQAPGIFCKVPQHVKRLWSKGDLFPRTCKVPRARSRVKRLKPQMSARNLVHHQPTSYAISAL